MSYRLFWISLCLCFGQFVSAAAISQQAIRVRLFKDLETFPKILNIEIKQLSTQLWSFKGKNLVFQNKFLPEQNLILKKENEKFDIISVVEFNQYLAGVVANEMPLKWPLEALKAQAVVARSYALAKMRERKNKVFHLDANQMDQVFSLTSSKKAIQAVSETNNAVIKNINGEVIMAFYHADCGGETIPASQVWSAAKDMGTAKDPWCLQRKSNQWSFQVSKQEFLNKLNQQVDKVFSTQKLREIFGFSNIRSAPLDLSYNQQQVIFKGQGFGHGVGLCQWGTYEQVKRGVSYTQVLKHYYPLANLSQNEILLTQILNSDFVSN